MLLTKIEEKFAERGVIEGSELLLRRNDAILLLESCHEMHFGVLGINFFLEGDDGSISEILGAGADFSSLFDMTPERTAQEGVRLLSGHEVDNVDWFSFVLQEVSNPRG